MPDPFTFHGFVLWVAFWLVLLYVLLILPLLVLR